MLHSMSSVGKANPKDGDGAPGPPVSAHAYYRGIKLIVHCKNGSVYSTHMYHLVWVGHRWVSGWGA